MKTIETLHKEWHALQPISPENQKRINQKFMLEFNYNSNHLEGNTLTYGQTKMLFMFGETTGDAKLRDYEEMKAHNVGLELVKREASDKERPLTENFIRELNRTILVEDFYKMQKTESETSRFKVHVGIYKTRPNSVITVTGEMFDYASPEETPALMSDLIEWYNEEEAKGKLTPIQLAALLHYRFIRIHPFEDGNGRIVRLLVNYVLAQHGYPMVIVPSTDKDNYLNILHKCDVEVGLVPSKGANASLEQIEPFITYMEELAKHALEIAIRGGKGESIEEEDDFSKKVALLEQEAKQLYNKEQQALQTQTDKKKDVINLFFLPLRNRIIDALKPLAQPIYIHDSDETHLHNDSKKETSFMIVKIDEWMQEPMDAKRQNLISELEALFYAYLLEYPKEEYKNFPHKLMISFNILFKDNSYTISCLDNKEFLYGTYPSKAEVKYIISNYKEEILGQIEKAIHE